MTVKHYAILPALGSFVGGNIPPLLPPSTVSIWTEESSCTVLNSTITAEMNCTYSCGSDCWRGSKYPCLQVFVSLNASGKVVRLSHNEEMQEASSEASRASGVSTASSETLFMLSWKCFSQKTSDEISCRINFLQLIWFEVCYIRIFPEYSCCFRIMPLPGLSMKLCHYLYLFMILVNTFPHIYFKLSNKRFI